MKILSCYYQKTRWDNKKKTERVKKITKNKLNVSKSKNKNRNKLINNNSVHVEKQCVFHFACHIFIISIKLMERCNYLVLKNAILPHTEMKTRIITFRYRPNHRQHHNFLYYYYSYYHYYYYYYYYHYYYYYYYYCGWYRRIAIQ